MKSLFIAGVIMVMFHTIRAQPEINCNLIHTPAEGSLYILPYPVGKTYKIIQSNCHPIGGHKNTFAYDFDTQMGDTIVASRAGKVVWANDQYLDTDQASGHENNVFIQHSDGTQIRYTHFMHGGALVQAGQTVQQGQAIGLSGRSGNTGGIPHLHFQAFKDGTSYNRQNSIPINFSNARGLLNNQNLLIDGQSYEAVSNLTSVDEQDTLPIFIISPNPIQGQLSITNAQTLQINEINIYSSDGKNIFQKTIQTAQQKIDLTLPNLVKGVYWVQISTDRGLKALKMIY